MKCIILLALIALCSSYSYGSGFGSGYGYGNIFGAGSSFHVNHDGSISITSPSGKTVTIAKDVGHHVAVTVTDPNLVGHQGYQYFHGYQPYDTLSQILNPYHGDITPYVYQQLLGDVSSAVQSGQVSNSIYQALHNLGQAGHHWGYGDAGIATNPLHVFGGPVSQHYFPGDVSPILSSLAHGGINSPYYPSELVGSVGPYAAGHLAHIAHGESEILEHQGDIHDAQLHQHLQQQHLLNDQWQTHEIQQQQQDLQQYVQHLQQLVQQQQVQVLEQQKQHQLNEALMHGAGPWAQAGFWHQLPGVHSLGGLHGVYGQGIHHNVPLVV